jgi:hypothetical protein
MDVRVLYLDIDDEITTAAARVRGAEGTRVAMVLPYGSRVATSRINFRLLARDATLNGKRLSIVSGDAATRALAASAGLPIFASVAEYESSIAEERGERAAETEREPATAGPADEPAVATAEPAVAPAAESAVPAEPSAPTPAPASTRSPRARRKPRAPSDEADATSASVPPAGPPAAALATTAATTPAEPPPFIARPSREERAPVMHATRAPSAVPAARVVADTTPDRVAPAPSRVTGSRVLTTPVGRQLLPDTLRAPLVIGIAILLLALVVGGVGAYVFLPTATAVITPRQTIIGPVPLRIVADPSAVEPDPEARIVPAQTKSLDVEATQTFTTTGKRVEETEAKGTVRFRNFDSDETNTIPRGSIVGTRDGARFRTDRAVTIPRAEQVLFEIRPSSATVTVTAVKGGPDGNVGRNQIRLIPAGEDPQTTDVTNPDATTGGKREEFPRIVQADLDAATKALGEALAASFDQQLADPALTADGSTVFKDTAALGAPTYPTDPATLLDDEVETFDLSATATGTVLAVDESAVQAVAEANIASHVEAGYALVDGSSVIDKSPGQVEDGMIAFPATITANQVLLVDPAAIEAEIRGKSLADAQAILDGYGQAQLSVWPDWVGTIPTLDARVEVRATEGAS